MKKPSVREAGWVDPAGPRPAPDPWDHEEVIAEYKRLTRPPELLCPTPGCQRYRRAARFQLCYACQQKKNRALERLKEAVRRRS